MANINDPNPFNKFKSNIKSALTNGVNNSKHIINVAAANLGSKKARQNLKK